MSKPTYKAADFDKPKVKGLAVHNAQLARTKAEAEAEDRKDSFCVRPALACYVLWGVNPDCSVVPLGTSSTAADFQPLVRKGNLAALAAKYRTLIGFVTAAEAWTGKDRGKVRYDILAVPSAAKGVQS